MDFGHRGRQAIETDCESGASPDERLMRHPAERTAPQPIGRGGGGAVIREFPRVARRTNRLDAATHQFKESTVSVAP